jgi:DNA ligase-1
MSKRWPTLYVKTAGGNINYWKIWTLDGGVYTEWGKVGTDKPLTDVYDAVGKNVGRSNETTPVEQAEIEAEAKFVKQLRLKYVRSIEEAKSNINIQPMRAYALDAKREKKLKFPLCIQPKLNGVRCMAYPLPGGAIRLMSRGGKDYTIDHIQQALVQRITPGTCLDGEVYAHGRSLQNIRHLIETPSDDSLLLSLVCYDITKLPPDKANWHQRYNELGAWFAQHHQDVCPAIKMCHTETVNSMEEVKAFHDAWVEKGYEGAMIRTMKGTYRMAAKSVDLLKVKMFQDAEFVVTGWNVGKDGVIKYVCVQEEGLEFEARPMGTEAERAELLKTADADVGRLLTVKFQERSDDNIPIFPVGVAFRPLKDLD